MKVKDFLEVIAHNAFLSIVFCWTIIAFAFTILVIILEVILCQK